eukprot:SAG31_NODE_5262_length_2644_cov_2.043615_2_plen_459_part_00
MASGCQCRALPRHTAEPVVAAASASVVTRVCRGLDLQREGPVGFLDLDPGQCEFTPPGFVSLVLLSPPARGSPAGATKTAQGLLADLPTVEGPIVGPPHTHLAGSACSAGSSGPGSSPVLSIFVGATSPEGDPGAYRAGVDALVRRYFELKRALDGGLPLVVNTMGWIRGVGLDLLAAATASISPRVVLSLTRKNGHAHDNMHAGEQAAQQRDVDTPQMQALAEKVGAGTFLAIQPAPTSGGAASAGSHRITAVESRTLALMAYFNMPHNPLGLSRFLQPDKPDSAQLASRQPVSARWADLRIAFSHEHVAYSEILVALNGSLVALCIDSTEYITAAAANGDSHGSLAAENGYPAFLAKVGAPLCPCVGLGIVASVDPTARELHLLTTLDPRLLAHVNLLVRGQLNLPTIARTQLVPHGAHRKYGSLDVPYFVRGSLASEGTGSAAGKTRSNIERGTA